MDWDVALVEFLELAVERIEFGLLAVFSAASGLDNWSLTLTISTPITIPAISSGGRMLLGALLALAMGGLLRRRWAA